MGALVFWALAVGYGLVLPAWLVHWWRSGR